MKNNPRRWSPMMLGPPVWILRLIHIYGKIEARLTLVGDNVELERLCRNANGKKRENNSKESFLERRA